MESHEFRMKLYEIESDPEVDKAAKEEARKNYDYILSDLSWMHKLSKKRQRQLMSKVSWYLHRHISRRMAYEKLYLQEEKYATRTYFEEAVTLDDHQQFVVGEMDRLAGLVEDLQEENDSIKRKLHKIEKDRLGKGDKDTYEKKIQSLESSLKVADRAASIYQNKWRQLRDEKIRKLGE